MTPTWFRVPEWVWSVNDEASGKKARAWVYLLGSWHAGNDPGIREVMRATGYGGGMTTALVRDVARWARDAGARLPEQYIGSAGTVPNANKSQATPDSATVDASAGTVDRFCGNDSRARVPYETRRDETRVEPHTEPAPAPAVASTPTPEPSHDDPPARDTSPESRPDASGPTHGGGGHAERGGEAPPPGQPPTSDPRPEPDQGRAGATVTWSKGLPPGMVASVLTCIEEVRQAPVNPARTGTDAKTILGLWRATGKPEPEVFAAELRTVIKWARESSDKLAAYDIRAVGWNAGTDRHRDLSTICRQDKWSMRLAAAKAWAEPPAAKPTPAPADLMDNYRRLVGILCQRDDRRLIEGDDERHTLTLRYAVKLCGGRDAFRADPNAFLDRWPEVWAGAEAEVAAKLAAMGQR